MPMTRQSSVTVGLLLLSLALCSFLEGALGQQDLTWDVDELSRERTFHDLKHFDDKQKFLEAENLAKYLGLSPISGVHFPVPLTFVFVGFASDGFGKIAIAEEELLTWFGHLDHILPHVRIEMSELSCAEDGYCAGLVHGHTEGAALLPVNSYVHLNFTCEVVMVKQRDVTAAFEHAIHTFSRPVEPEQPGGARQVDATKMEGFIQSFVRSLFLQDSYTIVVINPQVIPGGVSYAYRKGMSKAEIDAVKNSVSKTAIDNLIKNAMRGGEPEPPMWFHGQQWGRQAKRDSRFSARGKFTTSDSTWQSENWALDMENYLKEEEQFLEGLIQRIGGGTGGGAMAIAQAARVIAHQDSHVADLIKEELYGEGYTADDRLGSKYSVTHPAEDCMVANWVSTSRWLMLDLTASQSGFDWGPAMGGDGVVGKGTFPSVEAHFNKLESIKKDVRLKERTVGSVEKGLETDFRKEKREHLLAETNARYRQYVAERQARKFAATNPDAPRFDHVEEHRKWQIISAEHLAKAELEFLEKFAARHCHEQARPPKICMDVRDDVERQVQVLARMAATEEEVEFDFFPSHKWDLFGDLDASHADHEEVVDESLRARDLFMAELSALMSRAMRHVIAPPTAAWTHDESAGQTRDVANSFKPRISFHVYVLSDSARYMEEDADHSGLHKFDTVAFSQQVDTLSLGRQSFNWKFHEMMLMDDYQMATAVSMSHRTSNMDFDVPLEDQDYDDSYKGHEIQYIDSRELRLRLMNHSQLSKVQPQGSHMDVPIIILQFDRNQPVLLDQHYNARSLGDMIVIVQNSARYGEHPTGMMCKDQILARPVSPLKEALAVTLTFLGGVLPPHLGYDPTRKKVTHDWLWSVGAHPLSFTSSGFRYTELQRDLLGRSYLLDAMDSAIDVLNRGIRILEDARATHEMHFHMLKSQATARSAIESFRAVVSTMRNIVGNAEVLDYDKAVGELQSLKQEALSFLGACKLLAVANEHAHCRGRTTDDRSPHVAPILITSALLAAGAIVFSLLPLLRRKKERRLMY